MRRLALFATSFLFAAAAFGAAQAAEPPFDGVVVFGDSLSDNGNISTVLGLPGRARYTTNPGLVGLELVAQHYGYSLTPSLAGGADYAFGGAGINTNAPGTPAAVPTLTTQIGGYLSGGKQLDPRTLYSVWGGANDLFYHAAAATAGAQADALIAQRTAGLPAAQAAAVAAQIRAGAAAAAGVAAVETSDQAGLAVSAAAQQELALIGQMQQAGARYIVVFNLPDVGQTPSARAQGPAGMAGATALATAFNNVLNGGLQQMSAGVIPVNTFGLLREITASPATYGLTNVTTPACAGSSIACTPASLATPNAASTYLYADSVHPTTAAHAMLAQAVVAEIAAPQQMSVLSEAPLAFLEAHRAAVGDQLAVDMAEPAGGLRVFAVAGGGRRKLPGTFDVAGARSDDEMLTLGLDWGNGSGMSVGGALSFAKADADMGAVGGFKAKEVLGSFFVQQAWSNGAWAGGQLGFGGTKYNDITRRLSIGPALRVETSDANGTDMSAALAGGWWLDMGGLKTGPFASLTYDRVRVERFDEGDADSTAMWFGGWARDALVGRAGWKLQGVWDLGGTAVTPLVSVAYAHDFRADPVEVRAGLTTMGGAFEIPGYQPDENWGEAQLGFSAKFGPARAFAAWRGRFGGDAEENTGSVGLSYSF